MNFLFDYKQQSGLLQLIAKPDGEIVSITTSLAKLINYNAKKPLSFHELLSDISNYNSQIAAQVTKKMQSNHEVTDLIIKIAHVMSPMLVTIMPIISIDSTLLSCCTFRASRIPSPLELINEPMYKNSLTYNTKNQQYSLSDLEHAILFLLGIGLKQREVGKFLGYTRGYIASIIAYRLCPAFGVIDGSSLRLIEIARGVIWSNQHVPQLVADKLLPVLL